MKTRNFIHSVGIILSLTFCAPFSSFCQSCSGHWVTNRPRTFQCITGQQIGLPGVGDDPPGCPVNPVYTSLQTNTFLFDNPVNDFFVDFNAFDSDQPPGCPRMQVKINGIFYPLTTSNLTELPPGTGCSGSVSFLVITSNGYITSAVGSSNGQSRLVFSGVNASSITISTNDRGGGIVVGNPCFELLPVEIESFSGKAIANCEVKLQFESGLESNVRNIEIEGSLAGAIFSKLVELLPQGSDSRYAVSLKSSGHNFFRLRINDLDGHFAYSDVIRINDICTSLPIRISPNPAVEKILVENVQRDDQLIVVDMMGREVFRQQAINNSTEMIIQHLTTGLYFLKVFRTITKIETVKFLKK